MIRKSRLNTVLASLSALAAVLVVACPPAEAQVKPFAIAGAGVAPMGLPLPREAPRPHTIAGNATFLGSYTGQGTVETDTAVPNTSTGHITGQFGSGEPFVFTGENGDILACEYGRVQYGASKPGTFDLTPLPALGAGVYQAAFVAEFVPVTSERTGVFAGVTGGWVMYAFTEPFVLGSSDPIQYVWEGVGSLTFKAGKGNPGNGTTGKGGGPTPGKGKGKALLLSKKPK